MSSLRTQMAGSPDDSYFNFQNAAGAPAAAPTPPPCAHHTSRSAAPRGVLADDVNTLLATLEREMRVDASTTRAIVSTRHARSASASVAPTARLSPVSTNTRAPSRAPPRNSATPRGAQFEHRPGARREEPPPGAARAHELERACGNCRAIARKSP